MIDTRNPPARSASVPFAGLQSVTSAGPPPEQLGRDGSRQIDGRSRISAILPMHMPLFASLLTSHRAGLYAISIRNRNRKLTLFLVSLRAFLSLELRSNSMTRFS